MSFGFSISDFVTLGGFALKLYDEFRQAPGACQAFAKELLLFHRILDKLGSDLQCNQASLGPSDYAALEACANSCKTLIYIDIYGAASVPGTIMWTNLRTGKATMPYHAILENGLTGDDRLLRSWRRKWGEKKFAARIPKLQQAIAAHIQSLTAFSTLIVRSDQLKLFACHDRLNALHDQTQAYLQDTHTSYSESQTRLEAASERLERSQAKVERQLEAILASQQKQGRPILSKSLDASSPEGCETWMNLGRMLRAEGITTAMIKQNRDVLVKAMKTTLQEGESLDTPQSYHTALESFSYRHRTLTEPTSSCASAQASLGLLSSAPPRVPSFTDCYLARPNRVAHPLDQDANVIDGVQSLLQGMDDYQLASGPADVHEQDDMYLEGLHETNETGEIDISVGVTQDNGLTAEGKV